MLTKLFCDIFFKKLIGAADMYLVGSAPMRMRCNLARVRRTKEGSDMVDMCLPGDSAELDPLFTNAVLLELSSVTLRSRAQQFTELAQQAGVLRGRAAIYNLAQRPGFNAAISTFAPTQLRKSILYDLVTQQEVLPVLYFLMHGVPLPGVSNAVSCPFPGILIQDATGGWECDMCDSVVKGLVGNSFHMAAVGAMIMFMLAVIS